MHPVLMLEELMKASQAQRGVLAHDSVLRAEIHEICSGPDERGSPKRTKALQDAVDKWEATEKLRWH